MMDGGDFLHIAIAVVTFLAYAKARITQLLIRREEHDSLET